MIIFLLFLIVLKVRKNKSFIEKIFANKQINFIFAAYVVLLEFKAHSTIVINPKLQINKL
jgi:hypothetical protein